MPSPYTTLILADNPLAYYHCDETSGAVLNDSSGNDHDLILQTYNGSGHSFQPRGHDPLVDAEPSGHSLYTAFPPAGNWSGSSADCCWAYTKRTIPKDTWQNLTGDFTLEVWASITDQENTYGRVYHLLWGTNDFWLGFHVGFTPDSPGDSVIGWAGFCYLDGTPTTLRKVLSPGKLFENTTYHVAVVREDTELRLYVNCELSATATIPAGALKDAGGPLWLNSEEFFEYTSAYVDEIAIYDYALTEEQLCAHVGVEPPPDPPDPPDPDPVLPPPENLRLLIVGSLEPEANKGYSRLVYDLGRGYTPSVLVGHSGGSQFWKYVFKALPDRPDDTRFVVHDLELDADLTWARYLDGFMNRRMADGLPFIATDQRTGNDVYVVFVGDELNLTMTTAGNYTTEIRLREYRDVQDV